MSACLVHCTCPDDSSAARIAEAVVAQRLAACVSRLPGVCSTYRWEGAVEQADEVLLLIKTTTARLDALVACIQALHPYELPEVLAVEASGGSAAYLAWVADATRPGVPSE
jgi:periplasmic divalent cation tolerance protein